MRLFRPLIPIRCRYQGFIREPGHDWHHARCTWWQWLGRPWRPRWRALG